VELRGSELRFWDCEESTQVWSSRADADVQIDV
jgi:hypothetical protein